MVWYAKSNNKEEKSSVGTQTVHFNLKGEKGDRQSRREISSYSRHKT